MALSIRRAETGADRDKCYQIRMIVFVEEQKVPPWEEMDHFDEDALHFLAEDNGVVIGTARLVDKGNGEGKIGRVAVLNEYRGKKVGHGLMAHILQTADNQYQTFVLDAQVQVIPFYEKLGFTAEGDIFLDAGIEHRRMILTR